MSGRTWVSAPPSGWRNWKGGFVRSRFHPDYQRAKNIKKNFGMTLEEWDALFASQGHRCAICWTSTPGGKHNQWHTDHVHETGIVRGILCALCNLGLGCFSDDASKLTLAVDYLGRYQ